MPYVATMEWLPPASADVVHVAIPVAGFTATGVEHAAIALPLSVKVTEPESWTVPLMGVIVAVRVTDVFTTVVADDVVKLVLLVIGVTTCVNVFDVLFR